MYLDLVEYLREQGYSDIRIVEVKEKYLKMLVDGRIVEVKKKDNIVLVRAYLIDPRLGFAVWKFFATP